MFDISIFYFFNILVTGIILMVSIISSIIGTREINPRMHSFFWFMIFCYLFVFNIEYTGTITLKRYYSDFILFFIPAFAFIYIFSFISEKKFYFSFLSFIIPAVSCLFKVKIPLFSLFYDLVMWLLLIGVAYYNFNRNKNANKDTIKKSRYIFLWTLFIATGYIPYVLINLSLSFIKKRPMHILTILPVFIAVSSFIVLFYYYKTSIYYNNEGIKKSSIFEKQTLIEKIAASLIHEIKNPIAAIQSLNQQLQNNYKKMEDESIDKYLSIIAKDLDRIKDLSDSFLKSYKRDANQKDTVSDIYLIAQSVYTLIKFDLMKKEITFTIDKSLLNKKVMIGSYQLRQIFLNLFYNSIEANAGMITIKAVDNDDIIDIYIEDDGDGIKSSDMKNIFTPFYSTKNDGIGIGLAICQKIVHDFSGAITLVSSKERKTIFKFTLQKIKTI